MSVEGVGGNGSFTVTVTTNGGLSDLRGDFFFYLPYGSTILPTQPFPPRPIDNSTFAGHPIPMTPRSRHSKKALVWLTSALLVLSFVPVHACLDSASCACCEDVQNVEASSCCAADGQAPAPLADTAPEADCCIVIGFNDEPVVTTQNTPPVKPAEQALAVSADDISIADNRRPLRDEHAAASPNGPRIHLVHCRLIL